MWSKCIYHFVNCESVMQFEQKFFIHIKWFLNVKSILHYTDTIRVICFGRINNSKIMYCSGTKKTISYFSVYECLFVWK